ncbi:MULTISPECIES: hypothetical protein [unclassified Sphingobium]|nr:MULTISPECIES: hypothetical protein [unclassified Sphingobium]MCW2413075.1 site-specific recombinase XerC [Sphingobium sp. B8D3D]MCW2414628.1 site-specific recombinase XerC [Sphingobium sp. B8D3A]
MDVDSRAYGTHYDAADQGSAHLKAAGNLRAVQILLGRTEIGHTVVVA